jgi:hypothetical protein
MENNTKIEKYDPGFDSDCEFYKITFSDKKEITTKVSPKMKEDLELFGVIPSDITVEEKQKVLEGYLIGSAQKFVDLGLDREKSDNDGKFATGSDLDGILDEEF